MVRAQLTRQAENGAWLLIHAPLVTRGLAARHCDRVTGNPKLFAVQKSCSSPKSKVHLEGDPEESFPTRDGLSPRTQMLIRSEGSFYWVKMSHSSKDG